VTNHTLNINFVPSDTLSAEELALQAEEIRSTLQAEYPDIEITISMSEEKTPAKEYRTVEEILFDASKVAVGLLTLSNSKP